MADTPKHSVSVAGIVVDDQDRVLVIQRRDNGNWEPPGGVLELGETPEFGARREVMEETGLDVEVERLTGVYKNMHRGIVALVFRCSVRGGDLATSDESRSVQWIDLADVTNYMNAAYSARVIDAFYAEASVRSHDGVSLLDSPARVSLTDRD